MQQEPVAVEITLAAHGTRASIDVRFTHLAIISRFRISLLTICTLWTLIASPHRCEAHSQWPGQNPRRSTSHIRGIRHMMQPSSEWRSRRRVCKLRIDVLRVPTRGRRLAASARRSNASRLRGDSKVSPRRASSSALAPRSTRSAGSSPRTEARSPRTPSAWPERADPPGPLSTYVSHDGGHTWSQANLSFGVAASTPASCVSSNWSAAGGGLLDSAKRDPAAKKVERDPEFLVSTAGGTTWSMRGIPIPDDVRELPAYNALPAETTYWPAVVDAVDCTAVDVCNVVAHQEQQGIGLHRRLKTVWWRAGTQ